MAKLRIQPHGRLQEWVAHENGYFQEEGLDYEFTFVAPDNPRAAPLAADTEVLSGAYELYQEGGGSKGGAACDVSSACHWAVNKASSDNIGHMWGGAYSVTPSGIYVPPESNVRKPEDLANVEIAVGYHSGSHFTAIQALEVFLAPEHTKLRYIGRPMARLDAALDRSVAAVSAWGTAQYVLEQQDFRRVVDTTFMVGFLFPSEVNASEIEKFMNALKRAQAAIDLTPERYKRYFLKELPKKLHDSVDVRRFGAGERIVFLPYTEQMYRDTQLWMEERGLFKDGIAAATYEAAVRG
jgi:NitT/TauT family transport system substrate-binding protein